jgi:3-phenylpropionate/trans-cinnamate dioxygenase ferredoxin reductase component
MIARTQGSSIVVDDRRFVIGGASSAGAEAADERREAGFAGRITLIGEEQERPYERPALSKGNLLGADPRDTASVRLGDLLG